MHSGAGRGGLDLKARGSIGKSLHAIVGTTYLLVKGDHFAVTISPTAQLQHDQLGLGRQVGGAAVEKDQRGVRSVGADAVARGDLVPRLRRLPGVVTGRQNLHHAPHVSQSSSPGDSHA